MPTYLNLANTPRRILPPEFQDGEIRYPESLVEHFLGELTEPGDVVFDPFSGYGTTLLVAEALSRQGWGIEFNEAKFRYASSLLQHPERLMHGDTRRLMKYQVPPFDLCMTSPPYTTLDELDDPLSDYSAQGAGYAAYLFDIRSIFAQLARLMKPSAHIVIEIANLKTASGVTPLAWDVAQEVARSLHFEGETVICWDRYGHGYDHSYCLTFTRKNGG